jgi:anti-sigma factor RsiW
MRCSSCELLLPEYLEGALSARRMAIVAQHVHACDGCTALVAELKVVDALLATATPSALPENFTFAVMAEVRSMPASQATRVPIWLAAAGYVLATWLLVGGWFLVRGTGAIASAQAALAPFFAGVAVLAHAGAGAGHALAPDAVALGAIVGVVLMLDLLLLAGLFYFYRNVRPRLLAATVEARR